MISQPAKHAFSLSNTPPPRSSPPLPSQPRLTVVSVRQDTLRTGQKPAGQSARGGGRSSSIYRNVQPVKGDSNPATQEGIASPKEPLKQRTVSGSAVHFRIFNT